MRYIGRCKHVSRPLQYHDYAGDYTESESYAREYVATSLKLLAL